MMIICIFLLCQGGGQGALYLFVSLVWYEQQNTTTPQQTQSFILFNPSQALKISVDLKE